jgi:hypothetical protein
MENGAIAGWRDETRNRLSSVGTRGYSPPFSSHSALATCPCLLTSTRVETESPASHRKQTIATRFNRYKFRPDQGRNPDGATRLKDLSCCLIECHTVSSKFRPNSMKTNKSDTNYSTHILSSRLSR